MFSGNGLTLAALLLWWPSAVLAGQEPKPAAPGQAAGPAATAGQAQNSGTSDHEAVSSQQALSPELFEQWDKDGRGIVLRANLPSEVQQRYRPALDAADANGDGMITREEFEAAVAVPLLRDRRTYAALLLIVAFAGFCLFLDSLFEPERRGLVWIGLIAGLAGLALGFLMARDWFLAAPPYLGWVAGACLVILCLAVVLGATRGTEAAEVAPAGEKVYVIGKGGKATVTRPAAAPGAARPAAATGPAATTRRPARPRRGSLAPGRVIRRAPSPGQRSAGPSQGQSGQGGPRRRPPPRRPPPPPAGPGQRPSGPKPPPAGRPN